MSFDQTSMRTPTSVKSIMLVLRYDTKKSGSQFVKVTMLNQPIDLTIATEPSDAVQLLGVVVESFIEDTDFSVDYVNRTVTPLSGGSMVPQSDYLVEFTYEHKEGSFDIEVLDENDEVMQALSGDLAPHLTTQQRDTIIQFLEAMRTKAESEIL
jgi:hypothetical protein